MKKGLFYAILASVLWAIVNPFIKQGLSYDFTPMNFAGLRFTTVGIILFAYTWHKGMWQEIRQHSKLFLNLVLINMFIGIHGLLFWRGLCKRGHLVYHHGNDSPYQCIVGSSARKR